MNLILSKVKKNLLLKKNYYHSFIIKTLNKMSTEGKYLDIIKAKYNKPSANVILNDENQKLFL